MSSSVSDINILQKSILKSNIDLSPFISKLLSAFLPTVVYQLEEYGLPGKISKKIQDAGIINFEDENLTLKSVIAKFQELNHEKVISRSMLESFDYVMVFGAVALSGHLNLNTAQMPEAS